MRWVREYGNLPESEVMQRFVCSAYIKRRSFCKYIIEFTFPTKIIDLLKVKKYNRI